tara:strand:- start:635 stop:2026 length:1392 start_codon:yes stop_codon:yes gene_type:complete
MFYSKIFSILDYKRYIYLVLISNFFSVLLLNDTTSYNLGLISLQSLIYSLNNFLFIIFILFETIGSYLDLYGLTFNFLNLVFINPKNLNLDFNLYIFLISLKYFSFLLLNLFFLLFSNQIFKFLKIIFMKKIFYLGLLVIFILIIIFNKSYPNNFVSINDRISKKINFIKKGNLLRNDNWYIVLRNTINYSNTDNIYSNFSFEKEFQNFKNSKNIYIIINESYPNFKNSELKGNLLSVLTANLKDTDIHKFKKNWNKNYSTQGSEMELFCDQRGSWKDFKKDLDYFLKKNDCWINTFNNRHNIFIHSFNKDSFARARYFNKEKYFFKESFFKEDLLKLNYTICDKNVYYKGICENQILNKLLFSLKKNNKKKLIIYLTVENHIPVNIKNDLNSLCNNYTLKLHPQFCTLYSNQIIFNQELNKFIKNLDSNDLLVFFSDTPPLFSRKDRMHFEDYIDVFFFKKK